MSPQEFRRIRIGLGFNKVQMAEALGMKNPPVSGRNAVHRYESGGLIGGIPGPIARLAQALESGWRPEA